MLSFVFPLAGFAFCVALMVKDPSQIAAVFWAVVAVPFGAWAVWLCVAAAPAPEEPLTMDRPEVAKATSAASAVNSSFRTVQNARREYDAAKAALVGLGCRCRACHPKLNKRLDDADKRLIAARAAFDRASILREEARA